ncbi:MAG: DUF2007 domain-containing protein [Pirellulaceae bacterium]|nr:DUF2007 domain-containing protein [Thermoguttaceae bacterium]MDI9442885.1 DUF2007 domain-containing protein [Planctomycetota bacterium]NLZ01391.1 DUF2007 domain-containing protein [Pirellulaceae bacterium]
MSTPETPVFLARERRDADQLVGLLEEAQIGAEVQEVSVGEHGRGWRVLVPSGEQRRARRLAAELENQRYGDRRTRREADAAWGVVESESALATPTPVYSAQSVMQAHFLKNLLQEHGIAAVVTNQVLHGGAGVDLVGTPTAAEVLVSAEDAEAARRFALEFDDRLYEGGASAAAGREDEEAAEPAWPVCPKCGAARTTRCPVCETSGTDFPPADQGYLGDLAGKAAGSCADSGTCALSKPAENPAEPAEEERKPAVILMCTVCDEPFVPSYPRRCQWCGHEFDDGYVVERIVPDVDIPSRAIAVVVLLGLLLIGVMAYFILIL